MSPKLPAVSGQEVSRALQRGGFRVVGTRGSHQKLRNDAGRTVVVPLHRELARGTLGSILRQAQLDTAQLLELLR